ncbi:lysozyme inhibitor LprI family protein [Rheinheimera pacifica]|uniref:lysozyme inhibitor LprI family protein n=1 Tax=Rheinheimera pacifica TaxID=173990 RepID=UPI002EDAD44A
MKFNWKVAIGIVVLISVVVAAAVAYWQVSSEQKQRRVDVINLKKFMSELNCTKPASRAETMICSDDALKQLDKRLAVAYHNNSLWRSLKARSNQDELCLKNCLVNLDELQQRWITKVRNRCDTVECLTKAYMDRITELNGQPEPLPTFRLVSNNEPAMCNAMLEILNSTPREQLGACTRHNFSGTAFTPVSAKLGPEHWQKFERFYDERAHLQSLSVLELWTAMEKKDQTDSRELYGVQHEWGEENDATWLLEARFPSYSCQTLPYGSGTERSHVRGQRYQQFKQLDATGKLLHAKQYGSQSVVAAPGAGETRSLYSGQLLRYGEEWYVLDQELMRQMNGPEESISKPSINLKRIDPDVDQQSGTWRSYMCSYWYNY